VTNSFQILFCLDLLDEDPLMLAKATDKNLVVSHLIAPDGVDEAFPGQEVFYTFDCELQWSLLFEKNLTPPLVV